VDHGSSEEDSRPVQVVENTRFASATAATNPARRFTIRAPRPRDNSGSNTTSSGTGTGTGSFSQLASSTLAPPPPSTHLSSQQATLLTPQHERKSSGRFFSSIAGLFRGGGNISISHSGGTEKWNTRTATNLRAVRRDVDSDSEDGAVTESPSRRLFNRRVSHDTSRSPSPAQPQKLRKRSLRAKEKDEGWISDGAAVGGRGARKGSVKRRATPRLPDLPPIPTSVHIPSPSAASAVSSIASGPASSMPIHAKANGKLKKNSRVEALARSSNTDVSRQSSLRSSGSAPPVLRIHKAAEPASGLPPSQSVPGSGFGRSNSPSHHTRSQSLPHGSAPPRPLHVDAGQAGSSQMSLMAVVEGVTRQNRAAWDRANAGSPADLTIGTGTVGGLVGVRAPPSVTKYNVRGEGGRGIAFETVLAPGSGLAVPPRPSSSASPEPLRQSLLSSPPRPLRSALRNHKPPPTPPKPITIPSAPPRVVVGPPPPPRANSRTSPDENGSDSESGASFRTVREMFDEEPVSPSASSPAPAVPGKDESDVSSSTVSAAHVVPGAEAEAEASGTVRRKSVRVSLQPTFSPTPPALDEDEDEAWERSGRPWGDDGDAVEGNGGERDFWADSSDEDEEYSKARRMLMRANKKRW
jgi:hypothetical protein